MKITPNAPAISKLQPGVVEEDQPRSPHHPTRSANQRIQWKAPPKAKVVDSPSRGPGRHQPVRRGYAGSSIAVMPRRHEHFGRMGNLLGRSRFGMARAVERRRFRPRHHTPNPKILTAVEHRQLDPWIAQAPLRRGRSLPGRLRSCDNASSGACEARAATSRPRSGGSGLYAPPRGHDQGRARGRWPRGAPVPLARLEG